MIHSAMLYSARRCLVAALAVAVFAGFATSAQAQWGNLKGKFVFDGKAPSPIKFDIQKDPEVCGKHNLISEDLVVAADGGLANVVVFIRTKGVKEHPDYAATANAKIEFDNKNCQFIPHVVAMRVSQTLVLKNSDPVGHNSNVAPIAGGGINPLIPPGGQIEHVFPTEDPLPVTVTCNIHPWMGGRILVKKSAYSAVSKADGSFEIKNLPTGELEFQAWQEKSGYLAVTGWEKGRFTVKIAEGDNDLGTIKCPAALFNK